MQFCEDQMIRGCRQIVVQALASAPLQKERVMQWPQAVLDTIAM